MYYWIGNDGGDTVSLFQGLTHRFSGMTEVNTTTFIQYKWYTSRGRKRILFVHKFGAYSYRNILDSLTNTVKQVTRFPTWRSVL
jgi:hypothetical protein